MNSLKHIFHKKTKLSDRHGYTMAEVLMVVAILGILAAVSFIGIFALRRNLKQTQADKNAEIIFEAAQRQMVSLAAFESDEAEKFTSPVGTYDIISAVGLEEGDSASTLYSDPGDSRGELQTILLQDQVSDDLYGAGWVVEYEPSTLQIKSVFYVEKSSVMDFYSDASQVVKLRASRSNRLDYQKENKKVVGYFDGSTSSLNGSELKVFGVARVDNAEELKANISVYASGKGAKDKDYILTITTKGATSNAKVTQKITFQKTDMTVDVWTKMRTAGVVLTLDSLKDGLQFKETYGSITTNGVGFLKNTSENAISVNGIAPGVTIEVDNENTDMTTDFIPGEDVEISVSAETADGAVKDSLAAVKVTTNSLFEKMMDDSGVYVASVAFGRHLQNLDTVTSGMELADFTDDSDDALYTHMEAVQTADIDFNGEWKKVYEPYVKKKFVPITNEDLMVFSGGSEMGEFTIHRLICDTSTKDTAGLFGEFFGDKIEFVTLINEKVTGSSATANGSIGGLIGRIPAGKSTAVEINGCQLYMEKDTVSEGIDTAKAQWMTHAKNIGGLVGEALRSVKISYSSASTVITEATYGGGLVGAGTHIDLEHSYADCYLSAKFLGGLAGSCDTTSTILGCYSAGFVVDVAKTNGGKVAGLTPSAVTSVADSYTVFHLGEQLEYYFSGASAEFYSTVSGANTLSNVYFTPASFDISAENKLGADRSVEDMKDSTKTGFTANTFAFRTDTNYGFITGAYRLTDTTASLAAYTYPMIILDDTKTLNHYGDWDDVLNNLTVRFLYSDQAKILAAFGKINLPEGTDTTLGADTYFMEDSANAIVPFQSIQEYTNAFIPQQDYKLAGRERAVLYWEFTYGGNTYYYVPDSADSYDPADGGRKYRGNIYLASDCSDSFENVAPWDGVSAVLMPNPLESVTQNIDVYARFYLAPTIQYIRLNYRIYENGNRDASTAVRRYIGKTNVVASGSKYTVTSEAHSNVGGYHFYGWATTETGLDGEGNSTILSTETAQETAQVLTITADTIESGDIYAIYEKITSYSVNVEFCQYDSGNDGWGASIAEPDSNAYSIEDLASGTTRKVKLPKSEKVEGYNLRLDDSSKYMALYFNTDGSRDASRDVEVQYNTSSYDSLTEALDAGEAYIEVDISKGGTYVVPYKGKDQRNYKVIKKYLNTVSSGTSYGYSELATKTVTSGVYDDGVVGANIAADKLEPEVGFELDHYETSPVIANVADGEVYVCTVYYKRSPYELFYDLNGGVYTETSVTPAETRGYKSYDTVDFGKPLSSVDFISNASGTITMSGCDFDKWVYYKYDEVAGLTSYDSATPYTSSNMASEALIAVAQWKVSASTPVRLEIYRQDRSNPLNDSLVVDDANKTYLLQKAYDISSVVNTVAAKQALYDAESHSSLLSTMTNTYGTRINNLDAEMGRLLTGVETKNYFTDASVTNTALSWATIKPKIQNGTLMVRLYYDRKVVTTQMRYTNYSYNNRFYSDNNSTNAAYRAACMDIYNAVHSTDNRVSASNVSVAVANGFSVGGVTYPYYSNAYINMTALYGADFDNNVYIWTDEVRFLMGNSTTGKRHLNTFTDTDYSIGNASNSSTTWYFRYSGLQDTTYHYYVYFESLSATSNAKTLNGTTYYFEESPAYDYTCSYNTSNTFMPNANYGYTLWAYQRDGEGINSGSDGVGYSMNSKNMSFYFIRKSPITLYYNDAHDVATHDDFAATSTKYGDTITLPDAANVEHPTDPSKYSFAGWYASSAYTGGQIYGITMDDHDMQVYAKWQPEAITVTYDPVYPDGSVYDISQYQQTAYFSHSILDDSENMLQLNAFYNSNIFEEDGNIYYRFRPLGEDQDSLYRFDGWWRKEGNTYTVRLNGNEVLYGDTTVYAKWTQVDGYADLTIRCVKADDTSVEYTGTPTERILLGQERYVYAPLVNASWGSEWAGYYPTQTRIKKTFSGDNPEIIFYYTKGSALTYTVNYYVTFSAYSGTSGEAQTILLKSQDYIQSAKSAVVTPISLEGYIMTGDASAVTVNEDYLRTHNYEVNFYYEPDLRTISMVAQTLYGTTQSFPEVVYTDVSSIFGNAAYVDALNGYGLVPMYQLFSNKGIAITSDYISTEEKDKYISDGNTESLADGTYRAKGQVRLQKDGADVVTIWQSNSYVNFTMAD